MFRFAAERKMMRIKRIGLALRSRVRYLITLIKYKWRFGAVPWGCKLYKPLRLINPQNVYLEKDVLIYKNARIETIESWGTQCFSPRIHIGEKTSIQQNLHMICSNKIEIGKECVLSANVCILDNNHSYQNVNTCLMNQILESGQIEIGDYAFIGIGAKILPNVHIGRNVIIGAGAIVTKDIPPYSVAIGCPAKIIKKYNFQTGRWEMVNEL